MAQKFDVLVVGGGIIGLTCAYELSLRGAKVTVIDKGAIGHGCSYGNAGWVTPCFAFPLSRPGMLMKAMHWLMDPLSPLYIKPELKPLLFRWLTRFTLSMNESQFVRNTEPLVAMCRSSLKSLAEMDKKFGGVMRFEQKGLLMICTSDKGMSAAIKDTELLARFGVPGKQMTEDEAKAFEPAVRGKLKGAIFYPEEAHVEPYAAVEVYRKAAEANGVTILPETELFDVAMNADGSVAALKTTRGELRADQYVLAAGTWTQRVAKHFGFNIPLLGGKGYAAILDPLSVMPKVPIMIQDKKIAVTPRNGSIRLAGTMEIVDQDESITARRVGAILNGASQYLHISEKPKLLEVWRGLRPCSSDGMPIIGRSSRCSNLVFATGHQMMGLKTAPATAQMVTDILLGTKPAFDPKPFDPGRFV